MTRESWLLVVLLIVGLLLPACQGKSREEGPILWDSSTDRRRSEDDQITKLD